jgi:beta-glucosidase
MALSKFPGGFLWGTAASAYQTEGGNYNNDWSAMERGEMLRAPGKRRVQEPCGLACDHWNRYEEDYDLASGLGIMVHRTSIEWSRVVPQEGRVDGAALEHYRMMLSALKKRRIRVMLCLHHFTIPLWVEALGGFVNRAAFMKHFSFYAETVVKALGDLVDLWLPINEPNVVPLGGYLTGMFHPWKKNPIAFSRAFRTFFDMHACAYHAIKQRHPGVPVGVAFAMMHFQPFSPENPLDRWGASFADRLANRLFFDGVKTGRIWFPLGTGGLFPGLKGTLDFVGLNYYSTSYMRGAVPVSSKPGDTVTDMGWIVYPEGLRDALSYLHGALPVPIIVTENGVATTDESFRVRYMEAHIREVLNAVGEGVPVQGYMCWSLTDNFEWHHGYGMRFGLIHVDYVTQKRSVKDGGQWFAGVIKNNSL